MSSTDFSLDDFLDSGGDGKNDSLLDSFDGSSGNDKTPWHEPDYTGSIDYRIRQLSYSSLQTLHSCPRKFQLYKLRSTARTEESLQSNITFAFGHVVGEAIASSFLSGKSKEAIIFDMFLHWHAHLFAVDEKQNKSFWMAVIALERLLAMKEAGLFKDYELLYYDGQPAVELSFAVTFPDSFRMRGFVDAVLRHRTTGKLLVLECKTTSAATLNPAMYKNSSQAIGYSVVLDVIAPDISSYEVMYLIYQTKTGEFNLMPFVKTYLMRAEWIQDLLFDIETIKMYEHAGIYPKRGESCFSFFRECEYFNSCGLSTEHITVPCSEKMEDKTKYQINLTLMDLLDAQLKKAETN